MGNEWTSRPLRDCAIWYSGGTPRKDNSDYWNGSIPWISAKSLTEFFVDDSEDKVTKAGIENGTRLVPGDAILFIVRGMSLKSEFRMGITTRPVTFNQDLKALIALDGVLPKFLAYAIKGRSQEILGLVGEAGHGTGVLPTDRIQGLEILLPPEEEQRAIAHILGTLDDKIELNRKQNETLEAMARALFMAWFVDFEPVRAKRRGRPLCLPNERRGRPLCLPNDDIGATTGGCPYDWPQHILDLFPDRLVESELGEIPEGWEMGQLSEYSSLNPESWTKRTRPGEIRYVDLSNTKWGRVESITNYGTDDAPSRAQRVLRPLDTIVGTVRPGNGSYALIVDEGLTGSTGFAVLRPLRRECSELVYLAATAHENIERLSNLADGGAYPAIRPEIVYATQVPRVSGELINEFSRQVSPMLAGIADNIHESRSLAQLRDTLLPKLIAGELRIPDAEAFLKERGL